MTPGVPIRKMEPDKTLEYRVYEAARDGWFVDLKLLLKHQNSDDLKKIVGVKTHGATPLVMACRNGYYAVAEYLIVKCGADIEQRGSVDFDGETIEGVSPLWCAAAAGYMSLVELLVKRGANVNSTTNTNSTPLRAACYDGHSDIVAYLVKNHADIELANRHGHTALMIACYRGHTEIVRILLKNKADVNRKTLKGDTALHDCAENGNLEIFKILLAHGARMNADSQGMTPLLSAAMTGHTHIVESLIKNGLVTREERINAYELLGATYVDSNRDMIGALEFWKKAAAERYARGEPPIPKPSQSAPIAAYDFAQEITDPNQLDDLLANPDGMRMQALLIRERVVGPAHNDTLYNIRHRGALYADGGKFGRCIELWNYALDIQQKLLQPLCTTNVRLLFSFTELFRFMIREKGKQTTRGLIIPPLQTKGLLRVLRKAIKEVKAGTQLCDKVSASECDIAQLKEVLIATLHLASFLTRDLPEADSEEYVEIHKALYELVQLNRKKVGRDVLELVYSKDYVVSTNYLLDEDVRPHLTKALLRVGADVMARDAAGNTALHHTALLGFWRPNLATTLLDAGAHIDAVNNDSKTFEMLLDNSAKFRSINPMKYTTLACLAARVIKRTQSTTFQSNVPKHLISFIAMH